MFGEKHNQNAIILLLALILISLIGVNVQLMGASGLKLTGAAAAGSQAGSQVPTEPLPVVPQAAKDVTAYKEYAKALGLNAAQFDSCVDSNKYESEVQDDYNDGLAAGVSGTPTTFVNGKGIVGAVPYEQIKAAIESELASPTPLAVSVDDDAWLGSADATVTVVEFSDFQCPYCGRFYSQSEVQLVEEYVTTGKVKFVYRDFPLYSIHPLAAPAANAAECAKEQGKFWEFHNLLFENQASWAT